ncbi:hypothetical protein ACFL2K_00215 [Candidatus Margulisiibacteriota bacterium]
MRLASKAQNEVFKRSPEIAQRLFDKKLKDYFLQNKRSIENLIKFINIFKKKYEKSDLKDIKKLRLYGFGEDKSKGNKNSDRKGYININGLNKIFRNELKELRQVALSECYFDVKKNYKLKFPRSVKIVSIKHSNLGDKVAKKVILHEGIKKLVLQNNIIGDKGIKSLKIPNSVCFINLHYNEIKDEGAKALTFSKNVKKVDLSSNKINESGQKELRKKYNKIKFKF